jgi:hypothetical protein
MEEHCSDRTAQRIPIIGGHVFQNPTRVASMRRPGMGRAKQDVIVQGVFLDDSPGMGFEFAHGYHGVILPALSERSRADRIGRAYESFPNPEATDGLTAPR